MRYGLREGLKSPGRMIDFVLGSDAVLHIKRYIAAAFIVALVIFGFGAVIGMGTQEWAGNFVLFYGLEYDLQRFYFLLGRLAQGLLYVSIVLFLPALFYWLMAKQFTFRQMLALSLFPVFILLLEQISYVVLIVWQGIDWYSSPFSWGVIGQLFIEQAWLVYFLGAISLFKFWVIYWQFTVLRSITTLKWWAAFLIILGLNILFWAATATLEYLPFYQYLFL
ncbi:hypothetical protein KP77_28970 [Jeotgalibacillus alimentarius]|uniref:Yip1 domain-containing protein n=1 Tax=Jeotgalibacillus alimentarius TaxID=135826 RepID=A0A0C2VJL3_9BACL|nr:hypothetical protein [Jeotgalibacillus alimentarius]KIL44676.1 hypothetical protein KP77_28970 [Jeotgalibacillus alimentarius]